MPEKYIDQLSINTIRFLAVDAVQKANSGHPGMPMGCAPIAYHRSMVATVTTRPSEETFRTLGNHSCLSSPAM